MERIRSQEGALPLPPPSIRGGGIHPSFAFLCNSPICSGGLWVDLRASCLSLSLARHNEHGRHGVVVGARQLPHAFGHSQQQQQFFQCRFLGHPCGRRNTNARSVHKLQPRSFGEHQGGHGHGRGRGRHGREDCAAVARNLPVQGGARNAGGVQVPQLLPGLSQQNPQNPSSIVTNLECFGTR